MSRRTQAQRRTETIGKLVQGTIDAMQEVGYAATTIKEICARAGVSQGGLFRHFATRHDLIVAAADEVARRQAGAFEGELVGVEGDPIEAAVRSVRARCHSPMNAVWHELMVACRTDPALREAVQPAADRYRDAIEALARAVLDVAPGVSTTAAWFVIHCFDGEAIGGTLLGDPDGAERRIAWVVDTLRRERIDASGLVDPS